MIEANYSPFVKSKRGEARALMELDTRTKARILPLFDVLGMSSLAGKQVSPEKHFEKQVKMIEMAWKASGPCYLDFYDVQPSLRMTDGKHPVSFVAGSMELASVDFIPVLGFARDVDYLLSIRAFTPHAKAIAIRLEREDLMLPSGLAERITNLISSVGGTGLPLHLLLDCRSLHGTDVTRLRDVLVAALGELSALRAARTTLVASSMVADMSPFQRDSINRVKRVDLDLWMTLVQNGHPNLQFGDYGVIHPDFVELDGSKIKPAAKIRYTTHNEWIVIKGGKWVDDTTQHRRLSRALAECDEFRGDDSWGGRYIEDVLADPASKCGTLETWVSIDQSVHITLTRRQVERILAPVALNH